jgi:hypothetical protein
MKNPPIIMYKHGEPTMIQRKDGSYINDLDEWHEIKRRNNDKNL